jgi:hypothetical protein
MGRLGCLALWRILCCNTVSQEGRDECRNCSDRGLRLWEEIWSCDCGGTLQATAQDAEPQIGSAPLTVVVGSLNTHFSSKMPRSRAPDT